MGMFWKNITKPNPKKEKELRDQLIEEELTLKDKLAMILSAYAVLFVPAVLVLLLLAFLMLLISGAIL